MCRWTNNDYLILSPRLHLTNFKWRHHPDASTPPIIDVMTSKYSGQPVSISSSLSPDEVGLPLTSPPHPVKCQYPLTNMHKLEGKLSSCSSFSVHSGMLELCGGLPPLSPLHCSHCHAWKSQWAFEDKLGPLKAVDRHPLSPLMEEQVSQVFYQINPLWYRYRSPQAETSGSHVVAQLSPACALTLHVQTSAIITCLRMTF